VNRSDEPPLFLTNYRNSGIGDFGMGFHAHLSARRPGLRFEETSPSGQRWASQALRAARYPGHLIANVGLTAWGRSGLRNFCGFRAIGLHRALGRPTTAVIHHAIEIFAPEETGYRVRTLVRRGAHAALASLRNCDLVVFSPRMKDLLSEKYGARTIALMPLPGESSASEPTATPEGPLTAITVGYWAPYKGIDIFLDTAERVGPAATFVLGGVPHLVLSEDPSFRERTSEWERRANLAGVTLSGYIPSAKLDSVLSGHAVGVLPYTSVSGASASFQLFAERSVPVIASDLPEFRYLQESGAGVMLAPPSGPEMAEAVHRLSADPALWLKLARQQSKFSRENSWDRFLDRLLGESARRSVTRSRADTV
jgi:glycosyltransferase involved in cell wall biosynthesis